MVLSGENGALNSATNFIGEGLNEVGAVERPCATNLSAVAGSGASERDQGLSGARSNHSGYEGLAVTAGSSAAKDAGRLADTNNLRANLGVVLADGKGLGGILRVRIEDLRISVAYSRGGNLAGEGHLARASTIAEAELSTNEGEARVTSGTNLIVTAEVVVTISNIALTATVVLEDELIRGRHVRGLAGSVDNQGVEGINAPAIRVLRIRVGARLGGGDWVDKGFSGLRVALLHTSGELIFLVDKEAEESGALREASSILPVTGDTTLIGIVPARRNALESAVPEVMEEGAILGIEVASNADKAEAELLLSVPETALGVDQLRPDVLLEVQVAVELLIGIHAIEGEWVLRETKTLEAEGDGADVNITLTNVDIIGIVEENLSPARVADHALLSSSGVSRNVFVDLVHILEMAGDGADSSIIELLEGVETGKVSTSLVPGKALVVEDSRVLTSEEVEGISAVMIGEGEVAVEVDALTLSGIGRADIILDRELDIHGLRETLVPVVAGRVADVEGIVEVSHAGSSGLLDQDVRINGDINGERGNTTNGAEDSARLNGREVVREDVSSDKSLADNHGNTLDGRLMSSTEELDLHDINGRERDLTTFNAAVTEALKSDVVVELIRSELDLLESEVSPPSVILVEEELLNAVALNAIGNPCEGLSGHELD